MILKKKQEELKQEWDEFQPEKKEETGENRKEIIKKGLENLKLKESGMKVPLVSEESKGGQVYSEQDALEKLKDKTAASNPGGLTDDELA